MEHKLPGWRRTEGTLRSPITAMFEPLDSDYDDLVIEERGGGGWYIAPESYSGPQGSYGPFDTPVEALQALNIMLDLNERPRFK